MVEFRESMVFRVDSRTGPLRTDLARTLQIVTLFRLSPDRLWLWRRVRDSSQGWAYGLTQRDGAHNTDHLATDISPAILDHRRAQRAVVSPPTKNELLYRPATQPPMVFM